MENKHIEKTLVLIKPDAVQKKCVGKIIALYEESRLTLESIKIMIPDESLLEKHYAEHKDKPFFPHLIRFMSSDRVVAIVLSGKDAIEKVRKINGKTDPANASEGTIRYLFGTNVTENAVHGSANTIDAKREIDIWFTENSRP